MPRLAAAAPGQRVWPKAQALLVVQLPGWWQLPRVA
jgi:hypothetical protein